MFSAVWPRPASPNERFQILWVWKKTDGFVKLPWDYVLNYNNEGSIYYMYCYLINGSLKSDNNITITNLIMLSVITLTGFHCTYSNISEPSKSTGLAIVISLATVLLIKNIYHTKYKVPNIYCSADHQMSLYKRKTGPL